MNQQQRAVVQQALEAFEHLHRTGDTQVFDMCYAPKLIPALRQLLEQPEPVQEPSYWLGYGLQAHTEKPFEGATPLYTTPPIVATPLAQPAVPLTDEQVNLLINGKGDEDDDDYVEPTGDGFGLTDEDLVKLIRRVEAHHGIGVKP
jgi:hypothetical protein